MCFESEHNLSVGTGSKHRTTNRVFMGKAVYIFISDAIIIGFIVAGNKDVIEVITCYFQFNFVLNNTLADNYTENALQLCLCSYTRMKQHAPGTEPSQVITIDKGAVGAPEIRDGVDGRVWIRLIEQIDRDFELSKRACMVIDGMIDMAFFARY